MILRTFLIAFAALGLTACSATQGSQNELGGASSAKLTGSVSAADPRAQAAGEEILRAGGNASDAAIAVMLALTVVEPQSSGIGGGGFYVHSDPAGTVMSLDGRETAPAAASPEWFLDNDGNARPFGEAVATGLSIGVPGNVALAAEIHERHGKLDWDDLFAPAIRLAREGFRINPRFHRYLASERARSRLHPDSIAMFYKADGTPLDIGTSVTNPALAETLEAIAEDGAEAFYKSETAQQMATAIWQATPGARGMTAQDIELYRVRGREPVCGIYRAHRICGMGPPSSGGVAVLQMLKQLERFDLAALGPDSITTWHLFLESQRLAYADRELYLADSDYVNVPVDGLIAPDYLAQRGALIDPAKALESVAPGTPAGAQAALADGNEGVESGTSHFSVADADGNLVSYTSTIEGPFGSGKMFGGFYLNNELTDFSFAPVADGKPVANRVEGGKRPRSSMAPTIVFDPQGKPLLVIGAAGGGTIPVQVARGIMGVVDFGLPVDQALGLPFIMSFRGTVAVEQGSMLEGRIAELEALGHGTVRAFSPPLKANAVWWNGSRWIAASDPRIAEEVKLPAN